MTERKVVMIFYGVPLVDPATGSEEIGVEKIGYTVTDDLRENARLLNKLFAHGARIARGAGQLPPPQLNIDDDE